MSVKREGCKNLLFFYLLIILFGKITTGAFIKSHYISGHFGKINKIPNLRYLRYFFSPQIIFRQIFSQIFTNLFALPDFFNCFQSILIGNLFHHLLIQAIFSYNPGDRKCGNNIKPGGYFLNDGDYSTDHSKFFHSK